MEYTPNLEDILRYSEKCCGKNRKDNDECEEGCFRNNEEEREDHKCRCHKEDCHCHKQDKDECNCRREICSLIESIALMETALAHILNAEGEKLQKTVKHACNTEEMLEVNRSVQTTLARAVLLEQNLFLKLDTACNCFDNRRKRD